MDTFMDKLAHKLTAQEIIKANTTADTEELNRLKAQNKEYRDCLAQMQKANDVLQTVCQQMNGMLDEKIAPQIEKLIGESVEKIKEFDASKEAEEALLQEINEKLDSSNDNVHKECVKVYRNVQAVVVDEGNKQTETVRFTVAGLRGKLNAVLGISIAALVCALGGIVFQILVYFHIL